ncbi:MAG: recombinase zinc beta ribbon domain-containing protein [Chloroflexi bacterium]|nr:recombinase zinc beta ribbon domain-containing protein [Chloroflexota bacterium]
MRRNAKKPYLLTGLVKCAHCGWTYSGSTPTSGGNKERIKPYRGYRCPHNSTRPKYLVEHIECQNSMISCEVLDAAVWDVVCQALLKPDLLLKALDEDATSERNRQLLEQIAFLERQIASHSDDDDKLLRAYLAGAFDDKEYAGRRKMLRQEVETLQTDLRSYALRC